MYEEMYFHLYYIITIYANNKSYVNSKSYDDLYLK